MYNYIQGCRGLAALFVVCYHLGVTLAREKYFGTDADCLQRLFSFGDCGVPFFFVLSGFIITLIHRKDFGVPTRLFAYTRKRVVRIYPSYIIIFSVVYIVAIAISSTRNSVPHDGVLLIKSILLLPQDRFAGVSGGAPVINVAWTLQYEMVFYAAIAFAIINRYLFVALVLAFLVNFVFCIVQPSNSYLQVFFAQDWIFLFLFGMLSAYVAKSKLNIRRPFVISAVGGFAFFCLAMMEVFFGQHELIDRALIYGIISAILIVGLVRTEDSHPHVVKGDSGKTRYISLMGDASYALYLIHFPLLVLLCKLAVKVGLRGVSGALIAFLVILIACLITALAFCFYVERPILSTLSGPAHRSVHRNASQKI